ncbi:MAG: putative lipid II flippase FtsW [Candidatus Planktophila sp.]
MSESTQKFLTKPSSSYKMLLWTSLALSILGAIMVFSASSIYSLENKGNSFSIVGRQFFFLLISIPLGYLASRQKLERWKSLARFGFLISAIILIFVAIPGIGKSVNGNQNWISLGFVDIQPSEIVKFLMILWAAHMLAIREQAGRHRTNVLALITPGFVLVMGLIMIGRDLGTTAVFAAILGGLLWVAGVSGKIFATVSAVALSLIALAIAIEPYRAERFLVVFNPFAPEDYKNAGWQPAHSLLGLASGGFFGVGLGASRQKWGNLAEAHTDFIFSVIGEELGLVGTLIILVLFSALIFSIFRIALRAKDPMSKYACAGIGTWIAFQTIMNIGCATSLIPVVGVTLPLISYGGSSLVATYLALGFVLGAARRDPAAMADLGKN